MSYSVNLFGMRGRNHCTITDSTTCHNGRENVRDQISTFKENGSNYLYYSGRDASVRFDWSADPKKTPESFNVTTLRNEKVCKIVLFDECPALLPLFKRIKDFTFGFFTFNNPAEIPYNFARTVQTSQDKDIMASFFTELSKIANDCKRL